ncbi:MAG: Hsp20/alpha crystallin family protein [Anaerolineales bacterium]|nr:Hsp20/alpha crystallin family protein [Anaerolineales bacterium]MCX7608030.1 Hsp20/alpha crystallin family protein [Anaerolineales bacterium]MDW8227504.1 Hsp20/alpha crystallin family protein [Anaerolineales bacterium]
MQSSDLAGKRLQLLQMAGWQVNIRQYAWSPPTDVYETENALVVRVEVAGIAAGDFNVQIQDNVLMISGTRYDSPEKRAYHQMEIRYGEFSTSVALPRGLDLERTTAEYEDGFLTVVLPKQKTTEIKIVRG